MENTDPLPTTAINIQPPISKAIVNTRTVFNTTALINSPSTGPPH